MHKMPKATYLSRKTKWNVNITLLILGIVITQLVCFEGICRVLFNPPPSIIIENLNESDDQDYRFRGKEIYSDKDPGEFFLYTPTGVRLKRKVKGIVKNHHLSHSDIEISINSLGFRHNELGEKREDDFRILVLGDSITFGDFVPHKQTYPSFIEKYLRKIAPPVLKKKNIEVINAGVGAIDLQNEFAILMETGLSVDPDIVLVGLYLNDAYQSPTLKVSRLPTLFRKSRLLRFVFNCVDKLRGVYYLHEWEKTTDKALKYERKKFLQSHKVKKGALEWDNEKEFNWHIYHAFYDWGYAWTERFWDKILPIIDMMKEVSEDHRFKLVVVLLPVRHQIDSKILKNEPQRRFITEMTKRKIANLDLLPGLRKKYKKDHVNMLFDDCYYRDIGNKFIGKIIANFLIEKVIDEK